jgi:hypothetical protein
MPALLGQVRNHRYVILLLIAFTVLAKVFPLQVQAVEPYTYAAGVDGYYNVATTFAAAQPGTSLPDFSRYHPNHPLLHLAAGGIHDLTGVAGMTILKAFNLISALACILLIYTLVAQLGFSRSVALLTAAAFMTMYVVWVGALSAEVHLPAIALQLISASYLLKYFAAPSGAHRLLRLATLFFALATAVHLAAFFWGFAVAVAVISHRTENRWRIWSECALIYSSVVLLVYAVFLVLILKIDSFSLYRSTMFIYSHLLHVRFTGVEWLTVLLKAFGHSMVFGFSVWSFTLKAVWAGAVVAGIAALWRSQAAQPVKILLTAWPIAYVFSHAAFGARADSIHSWLFTVSGILPALAFLFHRLLERAELRIYLLAFLLCIAVNNLVFGILPNSRLKPADYVYVEDPQILLSGNGIQKPEARKLPVMVLAKFPQLTFPEIWHLGTELGFKNQVHLIYCCGKQGYQSRLGQYISTAPEFFLVVDEINDEVPALLQKHARVYRMLSEKRGEVDRTALVTSLYFERYAVRNNDKELRVFYVNGFLPVNPPAPGR